ncbi:hypothetical protein DB30_01012 [Enhygromyxa salina]|uniref:Uncharacterized protein n=1 Tax=Enhygromyxa salina TaxID=215803 RepID=A0A0C1Z5C6_9BACT|nr:hypothetical protein DB30_01012 [Enhygromyxa salina]
MGGSTGSPLGASDGLVACSIALSDTRQPHALAANAKIAANTAKKREHLLIHA